MKKALLLALAFLFTTTILQAQITKGSVLLGGNIGFGKTKSESNNTSKQTSFTFNPAVGVAVKQNLVLGINGVYGHSTNTLTTSDEQESTTAGGGLFVRKYFPLVTKLYLYGQGTAGYTHSKTTQEGASYKSESRTKAVNLGAAPGLAYALSKTFHLELGFNDLLNLNIANTDITNISLGTTTTSKNKSVGFNAGLNTSAPFYVGFRFFFSK